MPNPFQKLKQGLKKTHDTVVGKISDVFAGRNQLDEDLLEELEQILIEADLGVDATFRLLEDLRDKADELEEIDPAGLENFLQDEIKALLSHEGHHGYDITDSRPHVIMVVGVNGSGKTTTIGKLAGIYKQQGRSVVIGAADTFRAAAMEQLETWADRAGVDIVLNRQAKDPASVAYDAAASALARGTDILIVDTAGRLHTQQNLMEELRKIHRVLGKQIGGAPHEVLLTLDATTGQNAIMQARRFNEAVEVTGLVLTKLDGTAKGGVVVAINRELDLPVRYIGVGEGIDDLQQFDPEQFAEALFYKK